MRVSFVWNITKYASILILFFSLFIVPDLIFGNNVPDEYKMIALCGTAGIIAWVFGTGWYLSKGKYKIVGLLFWIFIASATTFNWYWSSTSFDRVIINLVGAENALQYLPEIIDGKKYSLEEKEWFKRRTLNNYALAEANADRHEIISEREKSNTILNIAIISIGVLMSLLMYREIKYEDDFSEDLTAC